MNFNKAQFIRSIGFSEQLTASTEKEICFCGRSNVGKSSLLNKLCNRKSLAKVGSMPGKTTTINFFSLGEGYILSDLPGYGYAKRSFSERQRWAKLMEHYFNSERNIILAILLLDMRHHPSQDDFQMLDFLMQTNTPFMVVLTKKDKLNKTDQKQNYEDFCLLLAPYRPQEVVAFSTLENETANNVRARISDIVKQREELDDY
ncbi:MAG: ribosome biogenesis GTP-binding protein YihA/YsxC [Oscillospiraceae bacterium]|nr:ribosome biogenesis GTP-binding protein YihA/YsxC [Oscillospiraceae bacterium]